MKISHLGNNIQTIRKFRGMKQQELADKIGINMQSLSKIERGLNYPAYETLEKIMEVLDVTPNELLSGEWKYVNQSEKEVCQFLRAAPAIPSGKPLLQSFPPDIPTAVFLL